MVEYDKRHVFSGKTQHYEDKYAIIRLDTNGNALEIIFNRYMAQKESIIAADMTDEEYDARGHRRDGTGKIASEVGEVSIAKV